LVPGAGVPWLANLALKRNGAAVDQDPDRVTVIRSGWAPEAAERSAHRGR
jgi:hypothetical protein